MTYKIDKQTRAALFRQRLSRIMQAKGVTQTALARETGVDRSTVSQLLATDDPRLPSSHLVASAALVLGVSTDWLLGLSERPESVAEILAASLTISEAPRALVDERIFGWHREAAGYKIRHVPAALPDMLKTEDVMRWEYAPHLGRTTEQAIGASRDRLTWMRGAASDYEIAMPISELTSFVRAEGYYNGIDKDLRRGQIDHLLALHDQLFPRLRLFLFDPRRLFSAPVTVFGPLLAVIYLGQHYLSYRDADRVSTLSRHFDTLVREANVYDRDIPGFLTALARDL